MIWGCVENAGQEMRKRLCDRDPIGTVEREALAHLGGLSDVAVLISGCNRRDIGGRNVITSTMGGRYIVVLNPVDGHVNYLLGSPLFGASIAAVDVRTNRSLAIVYDGLSESLVHIADGDCDLECPERRVCAGVNRVVGLGKLPGAGADRAFAEKGLSWRSLGSTTLSVLEILKGRMDVYYNRTKLWNFFWALALSPRRGVQCESLLDGAGLNGRQRQLSSDPEGTIPLLCYRERKHVEMILPFISQTTAKH